MGCETRGSWGGRFGLSWGVDSQDTQPCLLISYTVPNAPLMIDYDTTYGFALAVSVVVPPSLVIRYSAASAIDIIYTARKVYPLVADFYVGGGLHISYGVPLIGPIGVGYEVPGWAAALVAQYGVIGSHPLFVFYRTMLSYAFNTLIAYYDVPDLSPSPLGIVYSVYDGVTPAPLPNNDADGLISFSITSSEGGIQVRAVVSEGHSWSGVAPGSIIGTFAAGRSFLFSVASVTHDKKACTYAINGNVTISGLLDRLVKPLYTNDPVRVIYDEHGFLCPSDFKSRNNVDRPTVLQSIMSAASSAGVDVSIDASIPGLNDLVPFDMWHNATDVTLGGVIGQLIGWARPYKFVSGMAGLSIVGGALPAGCNSNAACAVSAESYNPEMASGVIVNGGDWPAPYHAKEPSKECSEEVVSGAVLLPDTAPVKVFNMSPSRSEDNSYDLVTRSYTGDMFNGTETVHRIRKSGGKIVSERIDLFINFREYLFIGSDVVDSKPSSVLAERTNVTYEYLDDCADALMRRTSVTTRYLYTLAESPSIADLTGWRAGNSTGNGFKYKYSVEERDYNPRGYLERIRRYSGRVVEITVVPTFVEAGEFATIYRYKDATGPDEIWSPLGDGLWFHSKTATVYTTVTVTKEGDNV